jgi:Tfp pilus assembly protein PilP
MKHYRTAIVLFCTLAITGCGSQDDLSHLQAWAARGTATAATHPPHITPIPSIPAYHPVPFIGNLPVASRSSTTGLHPGTGSERNKATAGRNNPFKSFIIVAPKATAIAGATPGNPGAPPLQRYSLSSFTLAGIVKKEGGSSWMAVFVTPKGNVHRAALGATVGLRGGRLVNIHNSQLGTSFVLVRVPVAIVDGKTISRTIKIDQR